MGIKGTKVGQGPGMGSMPKGSSGSGRSLDHCSVGKKIGKRTNLSKPLNEQSGGGPREAGKKIKNPTPKCYAQGPQKVK